MQSLRDLHAPQFTQRLRAGLTYAAPLELRFRLRTGFRMRPPTVAQNTSSRADTTRPVLQNREGQGRGARLLLPDGVASR